jgi:plastocyanin
VRRPVVFVAVLLCAAALAVPALAGSGGHARSAAATVKIGDNFFKPRSKRLGHPGSVTWKWKGHRKHNVFFIKAPKGGKPKNCGARKKGSCTRKLKKKGTYRYVCTFHGTMTGKIRVL